MLEKPQGDLSNNGNPNMNIRKKCELISWCGFYFRKSRKYSTRKIIKNMIIIS
jgi:hypothetical protein